MTSSFFSNVDTQEAPKSLSLESSSSLESLASLEENDPPPRPLPLPQPRSGGAFASYVRRRGEPDGRTACSTETNPANKVSNFLPLIFFTLISNITNPTFSGDFFKCFLKVLVLCCVFILLWKLYLVMIKLPIIIIISQDEVTYR